MENKKPRLDIWGWVGLSPLILIALLVLAFLFTELNKAYWDFRIKQMCEVDGGDTVYKKVFLDRLEFEKYFGPSGEIIAPWEGSSRRSSYKFLSRYEKTYIRKRYPEVSRNVTTIFRVSDKKVLGKSIHYHRGGGDFPTIISHPSGYSCGGDLNIGPLLNQTILVKERNDGN